MFLPGPQNDDQLPVVCHRATTLNFYIAQHRPAGQCLLNRDYDLIVRGEVSPRPVGSHDVDNQAPPLQDGN